MKKNRWLDSDSLLSRFFLRLDDSIGLFIVETLEGIQKPSSALKYGGEWKRIEREIEIASLRSEEKIRLRELKKRKIIHIRRVADEYRIALTGKGVMELFRLKVLDSDMLDDDTVCMVVFDIPERHRKLRKQLRFFLKQAGFLCIQRSVWVSPFDAAEPLSQLFNISGSAQWVRVYNAKEIKQHVDS
ncbi:MAG: CRISPR-associated endonuclease Cas2 [bacterium]